MAIPLPFSRPDSGRPSRLVPPAGADLVDALRERLMSDLHMGNIRSGDRLPSIRQVAREKRVDHRAVAAAYRKLAEEGLVEILGRSGVRVARGEAAEATQAASQDRWLAELLAGSWMRSIASGDLRRLLEVCADASGLRCACVESNLDQMTAYCAEIGQLSGMAMVPVYVSARADGAADLARLREDLRDVDLVVTTQYHAATAMAALHGVGTPLVVLRINPELAEAVRSRLRSHGMTVVAATLEFGQRLRLMYGDVIEREDQLRVVLATDRAVEGLDPGEPILLTRAACDLLPVVAAPPLVFPHSPTIAADSVRELTEQVVRITMAMRGATPSRALES